ncbi:MAG TPA: DUF6209 family protein [Kofleriaceae bacterium]|nr:DUF6209 family protein [Kofleriaceae bacterium]
MATLTAGAVACAADSSTDGTGGGGGKADGSTPTLTFGKDWSEKVTGTLLAGSPVRINYALDRLQECRGSTNGSEVWGASGYASFDGKAPVTFGVSQLVGDVVKPSAAELEIPAGTHSVELWFASNNIWGCIAYDSNMNANYQFDVDASSTGAVLSFDSDFSETQSDAIHAGDSIVVHYDPSRLAQCQYSSGGHAGWSITAHYQVDGGAVKTLPVTRAEGSTLVAADPTLAVPRGHDLALWFSATSAYGCHAYDSNMNANYHFAIEN